MERHYDQGNLWKKSILLGLRVSEGQSTWPSQQVASSKAAGDSIERLLRAYILRHNHKTERGSEWLESFETSKPTSATCPPCPQTRPHLPILLQQFQIWDYSNAWACGVHSHSNHRSWYCTNSRDPLGENWCCFYAESSNPWIEFVSPPKYSLIPFISS